MSLHEISNIIRKVEQAKIGVTINNNLTNEAKIEQCQVYKYEYKNIKIWYSVKM